MAPSILHGDGGDPPAEDMSSIYEADLLEPIAIIGFAFKFPPDVDTADSFWNMLMQKRCASNEIPPSRMKVDAFHHPDPKRHDAFPLRGGCFLKEDIAAFDAPFFSMNPQEAAAMDPQQRGLLETAYHALENAGIPIENVVGSKVSVHNGCFSNDYELANAKDPDLAPKYGATGSTSTMLANRVSWFFDLRGPSFNIDSACSSSMIALDVACQGLRNGDSDMGIVSGCNLVFLPDSTAMLSKMGFLSPDGQCFSFDHRANGYARGEGFGALIIKRLEDALRDGDMIRAVIRATGSNQDGHTPGITQPSVESQAALIAETYAKVGLSPGLTRFFEAHATGTAVGDPLEAAAISAAFTKHRSSRNPLIVGALKANIGHLEGASGVAAIIKTILALEKGLIPPNASFEKLNPNIDAHAMNLEFPTKAVSWPTDGLRRASVNSFGIGGANSHAILEDAYNFLRSRDLQGHHCTATTALTHQSNTNNSYGLIGQMRETSFQDQGIQEESFCSKLLIWSAMHENGLARLLNAHALHFEILDAQSPEATTYLSELAYTLAARRSKLPWKSFTVVSSIESLKSIRKTSSAPRRSDSSIEAALGFVFTGQGAQWHRMGQELMSYVTFRSSLFKSEAILRTLGCSWSLIEELFKDGVSSRINEPDFSQPLCTALQIGLLDLMDTWIVEKPSAVVGHSSGEIAAAYCICAISHKDAIKIAYWRGIVAAKLKSTQNSKRGSMLSVGLSMENAQIYLERMTDQFGSQGITIACINSPKNVTISGDLEQIDALKLLLDQQSVFARKLKVDVAYHSSHMKEVALEYQDLLEGIGQDESKASKVTMFSSVTGDRVFPEQLREAAYWVQNMTHPVKYSEALAKACGSGASSRKKLNLGHRRAVILTAILELGPHSALQVPTLETLAQNASKIEVEYFSALVRNKSSLNTILAAAGGLHISGFSLNLAAVNQLPPNPRIRVDLPKYPFDHSKSYWYETRMSKGYRFRKHGRLDLLGVPVPDWNDLEAKWRNCIILSEQPWIADHQINGVILYPGAGMLAMAIEAADQAADPSRIVTGFNIRNAEFLQALSIPSTPEGIETEFYLRPLRMHTSGKDENWFSFRLCSDMNDQWVENCHGSIQIVYEGASDISPQDTVRRAWQWNKFSDGVQMCKIFVIEEHVYKVLRNCGFDYGPAFSPLSNISVGEGGRASAEVRTFEDFSLGTRNVFIQSHVIHPTTLDGILHLSLVGISKGGKDTVPTMVPTRVRKIWIAKSNMSGVGQPLKAYTKSAYKGYRGSESSTYVSSVLGGQLSMIIEGFESTAISKAKTSNVVQKNQSPLCYRMEWKPDLDMLAPEDIEAYCKEGNLEETSEPATAIFYQELYTVLVSYLQEADLALRSGYNCSNVPHFQSYVDWMRNQLYQATTEGPAIFPNWEQRLADNAYLKSTAQRLSETSIEGKFYVTIGRNLISILTGAVDPLDLLFSVGLVASYYEEMFAKMACTRHISVYMKALSHKSPNLKILEVGAGTGSMTSHILSALARDGSKSSTFPTLAFERYDFTDISASFFPKAQERFANYQRKMQYKLFNIEDDPVGQGMVDRYDVILASLVLHATRRLDVTLKNLRGLLKPNGKLIIVEIVIPDILRAAFVFGLLPGWWACEDNSRRLNPCITVDEWHHALVNNGYSGCETAFRDFETDSCHETSIIISTAVRDQPLPPTSGPGVILVEDDEVQKEIANHLVLASNLQSRSWRIASLNSTQMDDDIANALVISLVELDRPILFDLREETFNILKRMVNVASTILWVFGDTVTSDQGPKFHLIEGFARSIRTENPGLKFITLSLALHTPRTSIQYCSKSIVKVLSRTLNFNITEVEDEFYQRQGRLLIPRLVQDVELDEEVTNRVESERRNLRAFGSGGPLKLNVGVPGLLDSLHFVRDDQPSLPIGPDEVEVEVKATGVNFMDCLAALGQINHSTLGGECAGIVKRAGLNVSSKLKPGVRVAVCALDTFKSLVRCSSMQAIPISDKLSFEAASAVPLTFVTAYHALVEMARIREGDSILIHSGSGATGQAAIQIAQYLGAEVFATVGTKEKRALLVSRYGIPEEHVLYSRDIAFAEDIRRLTGDRGVDIVLNSLAGEGLVASWTECLANFGRFIEIGKKDIYAHASLPMFPFSKNASFFAIDIASMPAMGRTDLVSKAFRNVLRLVEDGVLRPAYPLHIYTISTIEKALRYMQSGKNIGKIVCTIDPKDEVLTASNAWSTYCFDDQGMYVIAGGLGGLGRSIARWMVSKGARHLLLLSRSGPSTPAGMELLEELREKGVKVAAPACDITSLEALRKVISTYTTQDVSFKGCIQSSMALKDSIFQNMEYTQWKDGVAAKVIGSWNLHSLLPQSLDFFVLLSSLSGIFGSPSQANYAAGNTFLDSLAHYRMSQGAYTVSLDLGAMLSEGVLAENESLRRRFAGAGNFRLITQSELFAMLDYYCDPSRRDGWSTTGESRLEDDLYQAETIAQLITGLETPASLASRGIEEPYWYQRPMFRTLRAISSGAVDGTKEQKGDNAADLRSLPQCIAKATSISDAATAITTRLVSKLARTLSISTEDIDLSKPMHRYGVDSLVAVEIRNWFVKEVGADVAVFEILSGQSLVGIGRLSASRSSFMQIESKRD